jgi:lipopolysaccharide biosynthesis regulator YciM
VRLSQGSRYQVEALEKLTRIYEQEKEWQQAVNAAQELELLSGRSLALQIAHYYCELAEAAVAKKDFDAATQYVKQAQAGRPRTLRGALILAHVAQATGDSRTALRLYQQVVEEHTYLISEALPATVAICTDADQLDALDLAIRNMLQKNPEMRTLVAHTAIVNDIGGIAIIDECVEQYLHNEPTLAEFIDLQAIDNNEQDAIARVRRAMSLVASSTPRYQCRECGFSSQRLLWQCPSCRSWETQRPASRVQFDTVLQHSIT